MDNSLILVYYIGTGLIINNDDVDQYISSIIDKIKSDSQFVGEMIVIPTKDIDTRIECINPKYITEPELIREHRLKMDELHEHLSYHITSLKKKDEEKNG